MTIEDINKAAGATQSISEMLERLGFEVKDECFVKDQLRISPEEFVKHTTKSFAARLIRELNT